MTADDVRKTELVPSTKTIRNAIRKVIKLTSYEDKNGVVWGHDTALGSMDEIVAQAEEYLWAAFQPTKYDKKMIEKINLGEPP